MNNENTSGGSDISANDRRLIAEAISRLRSAPGGQHVNVDTVASVLHAEMRRGRRDLFSLVRAGQRALDQL